MQRQRNLQFDNLEFGWQPVPVAIPDTGAKPESDSDSKSDSESDSDASSVPLPNAVDRNGGRPGGFVH